MNDEHRKSLRLIVFMAYGVIGAVLMLTTFFYGPLTLPFPCYVSYCFGFGYAINGILYGEYDKGMWLDDPCWLCGVAWIVLLNILLFSLHRRWMWRCVLVILVLSYLVGLYFTFMNMLGSIT